MKSSDRSAKRSQSPQGGKMGPKSMRRSVVAVCVGSALALSACGGGTLSASSSCKDFMAASPTEQHEAIDSLAGDYRKPDYASPLGEPEVPYYCAANPS